ncbi:MAG TPA: hypothetical protein VJT71_06035 [Pyrinomonadaceae bacterium]|nr:hypothetical protein [Pyrinomonadaceae bacterium]
MRVTMNIFSGRPNPTWSLPSGKTRELVDRLTATTPVLTPDEPPALGFRGFTLNADLEDFVRTPNAPAHVVLPSPEVLEPAPTKARIVAGAPAAASKERDAAQDVSQWLLSTAPGPIAQEIQEAAENAQQSGAAAFAARAGAKAEKPAVAAAKEPVEPALATATCEPFLTPIADLFWNTPLTRFRNNCYNYASNFASNTMAQPGRHSGRMYTAFECGNVSRAANFDGYVADCDGSVRVVALAIWPGFDFHWWRLHPGGFWAHKIGTSMVMRCDNQGRILGNGLTPANCDRGPYTVFCGFFFGPLGIHVL